MSAGSDQSSAERRDASLTWPSSARGWAIAIVAALLIGILIRAYIVSQPPTPAMMWDHHEYVCWGVLMDREGLVALYDHPPELHVMWSPRMQEQRVVSPGEERICNYPPGTAYILYAKAKILKLLDDSLASNTPAARVIFSFASIVGDVLLAFGCFAVAGLWGNRLAAVLAFSVALLAPPFIVDSAHWGQTDSWVLAPAIWMLWAMLRKRWLAAGVFWGLALAFKTQGVLFTPIWLVALWIGPDRRRIVGGMFVAGGLLVLAGLPFMFHSGLAWLHRGFLHNLLHAYELTTLKAFNIWYVDLLLCENQDATVTLAGLEKDAWGKLLLLTSLAGTTALLLFRYRSRRPDVLLRFAAVLLLLVVMVPTRVHERYIVLPLPFLICIAALYRRLWWGLVPFLIAASFQITALDWLRVGADTWTTQKTRALAQKEHALAKLSQQYEELRNELPAEEFAVLPPPPQQFEQYLDQLRRDIGRARTEEREAPREWALTILAVLSATACLILVIPGRRGPPKPVSEAAPR
jgi:hypothetical protein